MDMFVARGIIFVQQHLPVMQVILANRAGGGGTRRRKRRRRRRRGITKRDIKQASWMMG